MHPFKGNSYVWPQNVCNLCLIRGFSVVRLLWFLCRSLSSQEDWLKTGTVDEGEGGNTRRDFWQMFCGKQRTEEQGAKNICQVKPKSLLVPIIGADVGKQEFSCTAGGCVNRYYHFGK